MRVKYDVKGLDKFIRNVQRKPAEMQQAVDAELNRSALRVEMRAKKYAPWDTGWLSNTIYSGMMQFLLYEIVAPADYAIYVELGTRYMPAQPFLYPALEEEYWVLMKRLNKLVKG